MSERKSAARQSPTFVNLGLDGQMMMRLGEPIRSHLKQLYEEIYGALDTAGHKAPRPPFAKFLGFAASLGGDEIRKLFKNQPNPTPSATMAAGTATRRRQAAAADG